MRLITLPLLLFACAASAQSPGSAFTNAGGRLTYTANGGRIDALPRITQAAFKDAWGGTFTFANGAVNASGPVAPAVGSSTPAMTATRALTLGAVARGAARALPVVGTGILLVDIANSIRCRGQNQSVLYGAGLECDPGQQPTEGTAYCYYGGYSGAPTQCIPASDYQAACTAHFASQVPNGARCVGPGGSGFLWTVQQWNPGGQYWQNYTDFGSERGTMTTYTCPGGGQVGADGKCPTGIYQPSSVDEVGDLIEQHPGFQSDPDDVADEAIERGHDYTDDASPTNGNLSGPGTSQGTSTSTTTTTNGNTTTTTTTPNYTITYNGDTYNYTTTTTTTNGDTTTTTTQGDVITCGLPGTPPCKIDEQGTPTQTQYGAAQAQLDQANAPVIAGVEDASTPRQLSWLWGGIDLPEGACTTLTVTPVDGLQTVEHDICAAPGVDLLRLLLAWGAGLWTLAYCWRRFSDAVEGIA